MRITLSPQHVLKLFLVVHRSPTRTPPSPTTQAATQNVTAFEGALMRICPVILVTAGWFDEPRTGVGLGKGNRGEVLLARGFSVLSRVGCSGFGDRRGRRSCQQDWHPGRGRFRLFGLGQGP